MGWNGLTGWKKKQETKYCSVYVGFLHSTPMNNKCLVLKKLESAFEETCANTSFAVYLCIISSSRSFAQAVSSYLL